MQLDSQVETPSLTSVPERFGSSPSVRTFGEESERRLWLYVTASILNIRTPQATFEESVRGDYLLDETRIRCLFGDQTELVAVDSPQPSCTTTTMLSLLPMRGAVGSDLTEEAQLPISAIKGWKPPF